MAQPCPEQARSATRNGKRVSGTTAVDTSGEGHVILERWLM